MSSPKFKVGDRVKIITNIHGDIAYFNLPIGMIGEVIRVEPDSYTGSLPYQVRFDGKDIWPHLPQIERVADVVAPATKEQKAIAKAEADLAALKAKAAAKEKAAAEKKAKAEREKLMRGLSPAGKRVVGLLRAKPDAFGCQREHVIALVVAITGDSYDKVRKATAPIPAPTVTARSACVGTVTYTTN